MEKALPIEQVEGLSFIAFNFLKLLRRLTESDAGLDA